MPSYAHDCKLELEWPTDVRFEVSDGGAGGDGDNAVTFHAHRFVLEAKAPKLVAKLKSSPFQLQRVTNVDPAVFHLVLRSAYGGGIAEEDLIAHGSNIIDAAHDCDMFDLKLAAEKAYVKSTQITEKNANDLLRYAEALKLARLKEAVIDFQAKTRGSWKCDYCPKLFHSYGDALEHQNECRVTEVGNGSPAPAAGATTPAPFPPMSSAAPKSPFTKTAKGFSFTAPAPTSSSTFPPMSKTAPKSPFTKTAGGGQFEWPAASSSGAP